MQLLEEHEFVKSKLTEPADSVVVRALVANYRACGGRLPLPLSNRQTKLAPLHIDHPTKSMDVLDPNNHQKLSVLFCSYSPFSSNAPTFCVDPWWDVSLFIYVIRDTDDHGEKMNMFIRLWWRTIGNVPQEVNVNSNKYSAKKINLYNGLLILNASSILILHVALSWY